MAGLLAAFLAGAPLVAVAAGSWAHAGTLRQQHAQRRARIGEVPAPPGSRARSRLLVWADRSGPQARGPSPAM